ncbi:MAG: hypothetical protein ACJAR2_000104 [Ilumatobacter sp.]|jgi:hypothetical protein
MSVVPVEPFFGLPVGSVSGRGHSVGEPVALDQSVEFVKMLGEVVAVELVADERVRPVLVADAVVAARYGGDRNTGLGSTDRRNTIDEFERWSAC